MEGWCQAPGFMECQAPGFMETLLVGSGGGRLWLFLVVGVGDPGGLVLGRGAHADGAVGAHRVVPVDPLGGGELDIVDALPGALVADELGLVQGVEGLGQSVVVGVPLRPDGCDRLALGQGLPVTDGPVLHPAVGVVDPGRSGPRPRAGAPRRPFPGRPGPGPRTGSWRSASR